MCVCVCVCVCVSVCVCVCVCVIFTAVLVHPAESYPLRQLEHSSVHTRTHKMCACRPTFNTHPRHYTSTHMHKHTHTHTGVCRSCHACRIFLYTVIICRIESQFFTRQKQRMTHTHTGTRVNYIAIIDKYNSSIKSNLKQCKDWTWLIINSTVIHNDFKMCVLNVLKFCRHIFTMTQMMTNDDISLSVLSRSCIEGQSCCRRDPTSHDNDSVTVNN